MKNAMTPAGIEPTAFRFVAQHLNHCATAVPYVGVEQRIKPQSIFSVGVKLWLSGFKTFTMF